VDAGRFSDLYASEARDHLGLLSRSLLALESPTPSADAVGEAFRAAHTLKGIAAAMGHHAVADLAHGIEDGLEPLRTSGAEPDPARIDLLLAAVDALETAIEVSLQPAPPPSRRLRVVLHPDTQLTAARAMLIVTNGRRHSIIAASEPETFDDDFDGTFTVEIRPDADLEAAIESLRRAGDVLSVEPEGSTDTAIATPSRGPGGLHVRVDPRRLDALAEGLGELTVLHARDWAARGAALRGTPSDRVAMLLSGLQEEVLRLRMRPISVVTDRLPRAVRDAARMAGRSVRLVVEGSDIELDRAILDELSDPLLHLVRNAIDHGIEPPDERERLGKPSQGEIRITAERERTSVRIRVQDDGRGIARAHVATLAQARGLAMPASVPAMTDEDVLRILIQPGFSTAAAVTELSGRGVGMDVVANRIRALGGALTLRTREGTGSTFTLRLPLTLALAQALRVRIGGDDYAIPLTHVGEAVQLQGVLVSATGGRETLRVRDELLPLIRLSAILGGSPQGEEKAAVIAEVGDHKVALAVDELIAREQILITGFDAPTDALPLFSGATLLGDGRPALVLDPLSVA
jgi:two-component system, chemotaxis family, sensor kinase CheA